MDAVAGVSALSGIGGSSPSSVTIVAVMHRFMIKCFSLTAGKDRHMEGYTMASEWQGRPFSKIFADRGSTPRPPQSRSDAFIMQ